MKPAFPYTRVPGRNRGVVFGSSLWIGADHLLLVRNTRFSETYKRFFYRDIQALLIRQSSRFSVPSYWLLAVVALLFCWAVAMAMHKQAAIWITAASLAAALLYLAVESLFFSCTTHIQTAVSSEELNALIRTRHARQAARLIAAKVEEVQGIAEPLELQRPIQSPHPLISAASATETPPSRTALVLTLISFTFLLVDAAFTYYSGIGPLTPKLNAVNSILILAEAALLISSLVALWPGDSVRALRNLIVAALVFSGLAYYSASVVSQIRTAVMQANAERSVAFFPNSRAVINRIDEIGNVLLGVAGLIVWRKSAKR